MAGVTRRGSAGSSGAAAPKTKRFTSWSYSRYNDWLKCHLYAYFKHLLKVKEPEGPALKRGQEIDDLCTKYASGVLAKCPPELIRFKEDFDALRKIKRKLNLQQELAFTKTWQPTDWRDWENAWVRVKMDCYYVEDTVLKIIDFKTGRIYPDNEKQLDLYAAVGILVAAPDVESVEAELWYLDQEGENVVAKTYTRAEAKALLKQWEKDIKPMLVDSTFKPMPSEHACRYCFFGQKAKKDPKKKGPGLCQF